MSNKLMELFESDQGRSSMSRVLMLGSFIISSIILEQLDFGGKLNEWYFATYCGTFGGVYVAGKFADRNQKILMGREEDEHNCDPGISKS